nr:uncharacterized protein LOC123758204 [Procambarus clarkii]
MQLHSTSVDSSELEEVIDDLAQYEEDIRVKLLPFKKQIAKNKLIVASAARTDPECSNCVSVIRGGDIYVRSKATAAVIDLRPDSKLHPDTTAFWLQAPQYISFRYYYTPAPTSVHTYTTHHTPRAEGDRFRAVISLTKAHSVLRSTVSVFNMTKQLLLVSLSVAWVAALLCGLAAGVCEPDCSSLPALSMVADPLNCTQYYVCLADGTPSDSPEACPPNTSFNASGTPPGCTAPTPCEPPCQLPPNCTYQCGTGVGEIFNPYDCNTFYVCMGVDPVGPFECPVNIPYFNGTFCVPQKESCCTDPCLAFCFEANIEIPDPYDCTRYFICDQTGLAAEEAHKTCASGSNFDLTTGRCVAGAPCNILCGKTTAPGGSTTIPTPNCEESMTCTEVGLFPKCTTCDQQFFNCLNIGQSATVQTCPESYVFNTDPAYPYCVLPTDCPHHPLYKVHQPLH